MFKIIKMCIVSIIIFAMLPMNILYSKSKPLIVEDKNIKFVFQGKIKKLINTPLISKGKIYISLNDLSVITTSKKPIYNKKQITIKYSKDIVKLNIGSGDVYKGNVHIIWNNSPISYKNKIYIPLQNFVETIDKKYVFDSGTKTILICTKSTFFKVKNLINQANKAISTCKRYKEFDTYNRIGDSHDIIFNESWEIYNDKKYLHEEEVDKKKGKKYAGYSYYYFNDNGFVKIFQESGEIYNKPNWMQESTNKAFFRLNYADPYSQCLYPLVEISDILLAGLNIKYKHNDVIIEGDTRSDNSCVGVLKPDKKYRSHVKIVIDRANNTFKEISENKIGVVTKEYEDKGSNLKKYSSKKVIKDIDGNFKIKVPNDLKEYIKKQNEHYEGI